MNSVEEFAKWQKSFRQGDLAVGWSAAALAPMLIARRRSQANNSAYAVAPDWLLRRLTRLTAPRPRQAARGRFPCVQIERRTRHQHVHAQAQQADRLAFLDLIHR